MSGPLYPTLEEEEEFQDPEEQETPGPRLFYSQNTARDFFSQFNEILDHRNRSQDEAIRTLNANVVALTAAIERLAAVQQGPSPPPNDAPANGDASTNPQQRSQLQQSEERRAPEERRASEERRSTPEESSRQSDDVRFQSEGLRPIPNVLPFRRSPSVFPNVRRRPNVDPRLMSLPIRELSAVPSVLPTSDNSSFGRIPHLKPPQFEGRDGENVLFWLHQLEIFFVLYRVRDEHKTLNASQCISGEAGEFYLYLITMNDGNDPSWTEFRHAYISRYHNPMAREEILRHKLAMIRFKGTQRMPEYCEQFRHYEAQIYDMAFPDRLTIFLGKLPQEAAMFIRNADLGAKDMEIVYRLARTWATNVRSTVVPRRIHAPPLIRFGKSRPKSASHSSKSEKAKENPSSDTEDELDVMDSNVVLHVNKADMSVIHFEIIYDLGTRSQAHHLSRLAALATWHSRRR